MGDERRKPRPANPINDTLRAAVEDAWVRDTNPDLFLDNLRRELELRDRLGQDWRGARDA